LACRRSTAEEISFTLGLADRSEDFGESAEKELIASAQGLNAQSDA
jgi:hypothetical protein